MNGHGPPDDGAGAVERSTLRRSLDVLLAVAEAGEQATLPQIARTLDLPHATVHRIVRKLVAEDLVAQDPERGLAVGPAAFKLASRLGKAISFEQLARPNMRQLVAETGETVTLNRYLESDGRTVIAAIEESDRVLSFALEVGELKHLNAGASGKVVMAFLSPEQIDQVVARHGLPGSTPGTVTDRATLEDHLRAIRDRGFAVSHSERIAGAVGVAAPIFAEGGRIFGSLVVTTPEHRFLEENREPFSRAVRAHAEAISQLLGHAPPPAASSPHRHASENA
ncbi:IclR family transcriptional regulator domain-containing protein [Propylenella binzhouense]|uniref:IclR family transcriptional regulator n=1 Tax=Propylenella binzhouense TaxID=2555902 RepID=A0A964T513_9HYPH|nr:IclR family transcriptional regulator [Propylenella binzhouense]